MKPAGLLLLFPWNFPGLVVGAPVAPRGELEAIAAQILASGYRHDAASLAAALSALDSTEGEGFLVDYWRGLAHVRLAEIASLGTGIGVEAHVGAAVAALESAVTRRDDFADGYALLAHANDWQMTFHHENKGWYADRTERFLARAHELEPSNPRVALFRALDLFKTPVMYGGSPARALTTLSEALGQFEAEPADGSVRVDPAWGMVDACLALGDVQLTLGDLEEAGRAYAEANELAPGCVTAERGLTRVARRARLQEGPELARAPIPAPIEDAASGWPYWRGPARTGSVADTTWSSSGTELWRRSVGLGYSCVAIAAGRLFTKGYDVENALDVVRALDSKTGEELWRLDYPAALWNEMHPGGTLSTPVVDGERVYVANREGRLHCLSAADGKVLWERALVDEEALEVPRWGFAASPLVLGDQLILNFGRVLSLDKHTGKRLWRTRHHGDAYSTPTPFLADGRPHLAVFVAEGLVVVDPQTGKQLAAHPWKTPYDQNCASPLLVDGGIFVTSGMDKGCALFDFQGGSLTPRWSARTMRTVMSAGVADEEAIYGFDDHVLRCITTTGEARWAQRGFGRGALVRAGERLIVLTEEGELVIAAARSDEYHELARERVFEHGLGWTPPVLVEGLLYLRSSAGELVCRDHRPD